MKNITTTDQIELQEKASKDTSTPTQQKIRVPKERGVKLLYDPVYNKGTAFSAQERSMFGLRGLLPPKVVSQDLQADRFMENLAKKPNDLEKYSSLVALQDRNENLFYYVLRRHLEELMPLVYTPTVGKACELFGHIYRRPRGLYLSIQQKGYLKEVLLNWPHDDVKVIVVTDGGRILGLGDLGVNGMGIPIGKLALYTACAGLDPTSCLPITVDVGTNNEALLNDPLYLGNNHGRVTGKEYEELFDEFVEAVQEVFPNAIIQFEDFSTQNAFNLLRRYRNTARVFNDDIQGTASVALAGLLGALRLTRQNIEEQRVLFLGAGEAGIGIGEMIAMAMQEAGLPIDTARKNIWFVDSRGLVCSERKDLAEHKLLFAHQHRGISDFTEAIKVLKPTAIIGVSGQGGKFTEEVVQLMAEINDQPIIFALSNPTSKSECTAEQAYRWSNGRAIFASGSPFAPVRVQDKEFIPGQGNNVYIFPGVGLGLAYCQSRTVTDRMFYEAAKVLSQNVTAEELAKGAVYPSFTRIKEVSVQIAMAITRVGVEQGLVQGYFLSNMEENIKHTMYHPDYRAFI